MPRHYRSLREPFDQVFRGMSAQRPRSITCGNFVNANMGFAVSKVYIRGYFDENARNQVLDNFLLLVFLRVEAIIIRTNSYRSNQLLNI